MTLSCLSLNHLQTFTKVFSAMDDDSYDWCLQRSRLRLMSIPVEIAEDPLLWCRAGTSTYNTALDHHFILHNHLRPSLLGKSTCPIISQQSRWTYCGYPCCVFYINHNIVLYHQIHREKYVYITKPLDYGLEMTCTNVLNTFNVSL